MKKFLILLLSGSSQIKTLYKSLSFFLIILFIISQKSIAQNESLQFDHIGIEDGLSNEKVTAILQDKKKGFLWFGTANGLYRYDGYSFIKYQFDPSDPNSLSQNFVYTIFQDGDGTIWTSTYEGLCRYNETTENFTRYKPEDGALFSNPNIFAINEDKNGMLWVGSAAGELCRFDKRTGKFLEERLELELNKLPGEAPLKHRLIGCIYQDRSGTLWVGNTTGLHQVILSVGKKGEPSTVSYKTYRHDPYNPNSLSSNNVRSVLEDQTGIIWASTDSGLTSFDRKTGMFKRYQHDPRDSHSISSNNLRSWSAGGIKEDLEGNLWICTDSGLNKLNRERTVFSTYLHNPLDPSSISSDLLQTVFIDREGVLWAGSPTGKLNKTALNRKAFGLRRNDPGNSNSLSDNKVTAIVADSAGIFWIGTNGGGLNRWDKKSNSFTHFRHKEGNPNTLKSDAIGAMIIDRKGQLWIGNGEFLSRFNKQTNEFIHYKSSRRNHREEGQTSILTIAQDRQGLLWLGTRVGVKSFEENSGEFTSYDHNPGDTTGLSDYTAVEIFVDSRNDIWIGLGSMATDRFKKSTGKFFHYRHDPFDTTSISSNIVNSFLEDAQGIWMGTWSGGLCYFNYRTGKFSTFTEKHGLPDNIVYSILKDNQDHLWLSTGNGISRFDPVKKIFINYDYKDDLQNNEFGAGTTDPVPALDKDGILYFGGRKGFNFFDPMDIKRDCTLAPIVITQFKLFDQVVKGATELSEIVLDYNKNYFSFEFSSLSFFNPFKNQYKYKLEGVDKGWVNSGSRHYAGYTNLAPGKYVFKVKGTNNDGIWNEKGTSLIVIIKPPWWLSWWAYLFYGVCVISGLYMIARYQQRRVINKERERTREKELEQAREIEKAYHELKTTQAQLIQSEKMASLGELTAGIAHEIQNPLNFVNNFSEVNNELIEEMKTAIASGDISELNLIASDLQSNLEKINQHGKRADGIVKSMMLHSRQGSVQKEPTDINNLVDEYLRLSYHGHRAKDKSFNATIKTDFDENIGKVSVVPQELGRVLLNIYNNAFYAVNEKKLKQPEGYEPTIEVNTSKTNGRLELKIRDNGGGIPSKVRDKIFQPFFTTKPTGQGTGLGLSMSYDIIKMHQGELDVKTEEGVGTEFIIRLPAS